MKIRNDFVTNSSSSSFVLARKGELNEKQKEEILKYIEEKFLGKQYEPNVSIDTIEKDVWLYEEDKEKIKELQKEGFLIASDYVSFDDAEYHLTDIYEDIWNILDTYSDNNFVAVNTDLSY